jgi:biopolymer transport protein ExbD
MPLRFYQRTRRPPTIAIVSLIDILVLLLIFFVVTTTFKKEQPAVEIALPESKTAQPGTDEKPVLVSVAEQDRLFLDGKPTELGTLAVQLRQRREHQPDMRLALQADKRASFGIIIGVLDAMKLAGFDNVPAFTETQEKSVPALP